MTGKLRHGLVLGNMADVADVDSLVEYAVAAEEAGWDSRIYSFPTTAKPSYFAVVAVPQPATASGCSSPTTNRPR